MKAKPNIKYHRWHDAIIDRARLRVLTENYESHHVKPKSLGGSNSKKNIVRLTYREHFLVHCLLVKITDGKSRIKMKFALSRMSNGHRILSSWQYEVAARHRSSAVAEMWRQPKFKKDVKAKLSAAMAKSWKVPEIREKYRESRRGMKLSPSHCINISLGVRLKYKMPGTVERMAAGHRGLKRSEETRRKISSSALIREAKRRELRAMIGGVKP
jgi:hypothetical protein